LGNLWPWYLNISPLLSQKHVRATTPRGTCTAAGGLDAETFRGFQLAGETFLLTSLFIEPKGHSLAENVRGRLYKEALQAGLAIEPEIVAGPHWANMGF